MRRTRKTHSPTLKAKVAVEAIKEQRTVSEIAQTFSIRPNLVSSWKRQALKLLPVLRPERINNLETQDSRIYRVFSSGDFGLLIQTWVGSSRALGALWTKRSG